MAKQSPSTLIEQLQWRYATKAFDPTKKLNEADWKALEQSLVLAPSSYGLQPWKFFIVQNPETRQQLREVSWKQSQVTDCSHYVVFTVRDKMEESDVQRFVERIAQVRGLEASSLEVYKGMMIGDIVTGPRSKNSADWAARQAYIALGQLMTSAATLGVDTCPLEGLDPVKYDEILKIKGTGYHTVCACAVGYRADADKYATNKKVRFETKDLIVTI